MVVGAGVAATAVGVVGVVFAALGFAAAEFAAVAEFTAVVEFEAGVVTAAAGVFVGVAAVFEDVAGLVATVFEDGASLAEVFEEAVAGMLAGTPVGTPETLLVLGSASLVEAGLVASLVGTLAVFEESAGGVFSRLDFVSAASFLVAAAVGETVGGLVSDFLSPFFGTGSPASCRSSASGPTRTADCIRAADADAQKANAIAVAKNTFFMMHSTSLLAQAMRAAGQTAVGRFAGLGD